jgi:type I restriction enzyme S subunit
MSNNDELPAGWRERPFSEVIDFQEGPGILAKDFRVSGIPLVRLSGLQNGASVLEGCNYLAPELVEKRYPHFRIKKGDILLSTSASLGRTAVVDERSEGAIVYTGIIRMRPLDNTLYAPFIEFLLQSPNFQQQVEAMGVGSVIRHFGPFHLKQMTVSVPPLLEQRAIAHILGTLDDKIELNRRMNETLEAIAQSIFKAWFVDFDPVRVKMEGRQPIGMDAETAALFPDSFEDSALGDIPEGWGVGSLLEQADLLSGGTPKTSEPDYWEGNILWASAKDISNSSQCFMLNTERKITAKGLNESSTQLIDAYSTVVIARGATTGRLVMLGAQMAMNQTCYALRSKADCHFALYCQLREVIDSLVHAAHGSVFDTITTDTFKSAPVILPPSNLFQHFEKEVTPIFMKILSNLQQSQSLTAMRDALLPKLLSGEIRVVMQDAENESKPERRSAGEEARAQAYRQHLRPNDRYRHR